MVRAVLLLLLFLAMVFAQPFLPSLMGRHNWLLTATPVLITCAALRLDGPLLVAFLIAGGILHDLLLPNYLGMGPLLWALTAFLARSQKPWLSEERLPLVALTGFACSFLYLIGDRMLFLLHREYWSWNLEICFQLLKWSSVNGVLTPVFLFLADRLFLRRAELPTRTS